MADKSQMKKASERNDRSLIKRSDSKSRSKSISSASTDVNKIPQKDQVLARQKKSVNMKKLLMKLKQKCHIAKKTELPKDLMDAIAKARHYRAALLEVAQTARAVTQQDPVFRKSESLDAPANADEYEVIYATLEPNRDKKKPFELYEHIEVYSPSTYYLGKENREFQKAATQALHPLMYSLEADFVDMEQRLEMLGHLRDEKDIRQQDFEASGVGADVAQAAAREYDKACAELMALARKMVEQSTIDSHVEAITAWSKLFKAHHQKMNGILENAIVNAGKAK